MLPFVPDFARKMIDRTRREWERRALELGAGAAAQAQRCGCAERQADHMVEDRTVAVPADPGARRIGDEERLDELFARDAGELCGPLAAPGQPRGDGIGRGEAAGGEIIGPAEGARPALARPLLEAEGREVGLADMVD